jgi:hypothetical protein
MRPNFPSQIAQRVVAAFQRYSELLRIFVSFGREWGVASRGEAADLFVVASAACLRCGDSGCPAYCGCAQSFWPGSWTYCHLQSARPIASQTKRIKLLSQSYAGSRPLAKKSREGYTEVYMFCPLRPRLSGSGQRRRKPMKGRGSRHSRRVLDGQTTEITKYSAAQLLLGSPCAICLATMDQLDAGRKSERFA